jgi:hypothetical protein
MSVDYVTLLNRYTINLKLRLSVNSQPQFSTLIKLTNNKQPN